MYRKLDPEKIIETITILNNRIYERFPNTDLNYVCKELILLAKDGKVRINTYSNPILFMRVTIGLIIIFSILVVFYSTNYIKIGSTEFGWGEFIQLFESSMNNLILIGAALFFLATFETRVKRGRALLALHELREVAHVIDMQQLTKDPSRVSMKNMMTQSSPKENLNEYELARYLDYSSEMLSLIGKIAALYAENLRDSVVISAVNEIENLTTGFCRKIWQKLIILDSYRNNTRSIAPK